MLANGMLSRFKKAEHPFSRRLFSGGVVSVPAESDVEVVHCRDHHRDGGKSVGHTDPEADTEIAAQQKVGDRIERQER